MTRRIAALAAALILAITAACTATTPPGCHGQANDLHDLEFEDISAAYEPDVAARQWLANAEDWLARCGPHFGQHEVARIRTRAQALTATTTTSTPVTAAPVLAVEAQPVIPLSYAIRAAQQDTANALRHWWNDAQEALFGGYYPMVPNAAWAIGNERFGDGSGLDFEVEFHWRGFTPESDIDYGPATVGGETEVQLGDASYLIDNRRGTVAVPFSRQVAVKYGQTATASLSATIEIDTGVSVGARVGNPTTPAGLNTEISTALKISGTKTDVSGWSSDRTETQTIGPVQVPAGHALLAAISAPQVRLTQAMTVDGYMDMGITMSWLNVYPVGPRHDQGWDYRHWPSTDPATFVPAILGNSSRATDDGTRTTVTFDSISEFVSFLQGYDTKVSGGLDRDNGASHADAIIAASKITWHGTVHRTTEKSSTYTFTDVAPDQVDATIKREAISGDRVLTAGS